MSDAEALAWLDRLLDLEAAERERQLQQLSSGNPALHEEILRALDAGVQRVSG